MELEAQSVLQFGMESAGCAVRRKGHVLMQGTDKVQRCCVRDKTGLGGRVRDRLGLAGQAEGRKLAERREGVSAVWSCV